jgi:hypothetical protein
LCKESIKIIFIGHFLEKKFLCRRIVGIFFRRKAARNVKSALGGYVISGVQEGDGMV